MGNSRGTTLRVRRAMVPSSSSNSGTPEAGNSCGPAGEPGQTNEHLPGTGGRSPSVHPKLRRSRRACVTTTAGRGRSYFACARKLSSQTEDRFRPYVLVPPQSVYAACLGAKRVAKVSNRRGEPATLASASHDYVDRAFMHGNQDSSNYVQGIDEVSRRPAGCAAAG